MDHMSSCSRTVHTSVTGLANLDADLPGIWPKQVLSKLTGNCPHTDQRLTARGAG